MKRGTALVIGATLVVMVAIAVMVVPFADRHRERSGDAAEMSSLAVQELTRRTARLGAAVSELAWQIDWLESVQSVQEERDSGRGDASDASLAPPDGSQTANGFAADSVRDSRSAAVSDLHRARLVQHGFSLERAESIMNRRDELRLAVMEAQFEQQRTGEGDLPNSLAAVARMDVVHRSLREVLGDDDYERYRRALSLGTVVDVAVVPSGSAAERAGILPGDAIVSYHGRRVFDSVELDVLAAQGRPGEMVVIEVLRHGLRTQLVAVREPLGLPERLHISAFEPSQ